MLFASPATSPRTPGKATSAPEVATPVIDPTTLTPWLGPERAPPRPLPEISTKDELEDPAFRAWLKAAPPPPRWVASERAFLARVRKECAPQLSRAPNYPEAYGDRRLLRFLRQHKSEKKGVKAVKEYLRWRETEKIDVIRDAILNGRTEPQTWPAGPFFKARCAVLPCSSSCFDMKGNALCVEQYGFWPAARLKDVTAEKYIGWQTYALEHKSMVLERIALGRERAVLRAAHAQWLSDPRKAIPLREGWGEVARLCTIMDMKGLTLSHALLPGGFNMLRQLIPLVQKNYPWLQDTTHLVNVSGAISYAWSMLRPFVPKHTQSKTFIHSKNASASLTEEIRPDFLPEQLGGRAACVALTPPVSLEDYDRGVNPLRSPPSSPRSVNVEVRVPTAVVVPGVEYVCHDHNRKGKRTRKALRLRDRSLELLPTARWRLSRQMLRLRSPKRLSLNSHQPLAAYVGSEDASPAHAALHHKEAALKASKLPPSFVVLATPKRKVVTLELADAAQARALVEAIHMQADLAA